MSTAISPQPGGGQSDSPEEQLAHSVADAVRAFGLPPLQYLEVASRDGHVYLVARVPTLFLERHSARPERLLPSSDGAT